MEIALTFLGLILGLLGLLFAYMWRANGEVQKKMMTVVENTSEMVKESIEMHKEGLEILDRMNKRAQENHKETVIALKEISQMLLNQNEGIKSIGQMLLNQTKILERLYPQGRIEGKIK